MNEDTPFYTKPKQRDMGKRAEEAALKAYPEELTTAYGPLPGASAPCIFDGNRLYRIGFKRGYEQAEKDIIAIIESRTAEILGDAQPKPTIRIELKELITRIKEGAKK